MTCKLIDRAKDRGVLPTRDSRIWASLCIVCAASLHACTEPAKRSLLHVTIDADTAVREVVDDASRRRDAVSEQRRLAHEQIPAVHPGYLFSRESDRWKVSAHLKASNAGAYDSFGFSAALSGDTAVVSAMGAK